MRKKLFSILVALALVFCVSVFCACDNDNQPAPQPVVSMLPVYNMQSLGERSNCIWDLQVFNGKLYIGTGDYTANSGQTSIWAYDLTNKECYQDRSYYGFKEQLLYFIGC